MSVSDSTRPYENARESRGPAIRRFAAAGAALLAVGCGGSDTSGPTEQTVATVEIAGATSAISVDETVQLTATAKDSDGNVITGRMFTWSSNNEGVATVSGGGLARGVTGGNATISATTGNRSGSFGLQVTAPEPVVVSAVSPNPLVPGQAATITGTGFSATPQNNTVTIAGSSATVNASTTTSLTVTVPASLCASGDAPVLVRVGNRTSNAFLAPAQINGTPVNVAQGQQVVLTDPAAFCLQFGATAATEAYLIGVQSVSESGASTTSVRVAGSVAGSAPPSGALPAFVSRAPAAPLPPIDRGLIERWRRHHAAEAEQQRKDAAMIAPHLDRIAEYYRRRASGTADLAAAAIPANLNVGDPVSVRVLTGSLCSQFATVATTVGAIGANVVILSDNTNPANGYTTADFQDLAAYFDSHVFPTNLDYFGDVTDIDGNGRVAVVVTRRVNERPDGSFGFVTGGDFDPQCQAGNQAEVIYMIAPDPTGTAGFQYPVENARADTRWLLAHEFVHVIQNGRRTTAGQPRLASWQSEGQATYAEQIVGFAATGRQPAQNYGFNVIFNCSEPPTQACVTPIDPYDWFILTFVDLILYYGFNLQCNPNVPGDCDTPIAGAPEQCTWVENDTSQPCQSREVYGVPAVFFTWLTDQFGPTFAGGRQGLHRQMIGNAQIGFASIASLVGQPMNQLMAQWAASLYTDDRIAGIHQRLQIPSWDLFDFGSRLRVSANLVPRERTFSAFSDLVQVRGGSTAYFRVSGTGRSATAIRVRRSDETVLPAGMQVFIVRVQ